MTKEMACIKTLLEAMMPKIIQCGDDMSTALEAARDGKQNQAVGAMMPVEENLRDLQALVAALLLVHRSGGA